jgi:hypothetical protein
MEINLIIGMLLWPLHMFGLHLESYIFIKNFMYSQMEDFYCTAEYI